jgi:hypothetical protein
MVEKIKPFLFSLLIVTLFGGCSVKFDSLDHNAIDESKQDKLYNLLRESGISRIEAHEIALNAFIFPKTLANRYALIWPPLLHNTLTNMGFKKRGLCFQWSEDFYKYYKFQNLKTVELYWGSANENRYTEHNSLVVSGKNRGFYEGVVLDPWRHSGELFFSKVVDDKRYDWKSRQDLKEKIDHLKNINDSIFMK